MENILLIAMAAMLLGCLAAGNGHTLTVKQGDIIRLDDGTSIGVIVITENDAAFIAGDVLGGISGKGIVVAVGSEFKQIGNAKISVIKTYIDPKSERTPTADIKIIENKPG